MIYLFLSIVVFNLVAYFIPKQISSIEMYATSIFALLFATCVDVYLDIKYQLYWYFTKGVDWWAAILRLGVYPAANVIILNFFPLNAQTSKKLRYITLWSVFFTLYELGALKVGGFLHYGKWSIWYSAMLYPIIIIVLYLNLKFVRRLIRNMLMK